MLNPSPPALIYCLQKESCENTAYCKKASFFIYLCIQQKLRFRNVLPDSFRAKYYAFYRNSDYAAKKETKC